MTTTAWSTFAERRKFIEANGLQDKPRPEIIKALKKAGLVSPKTFLRDVRIYKDKGKDVP